ncbi:MAG: hypothetical protein V1692_02940 [bacterium]
MSDNNNPTASPLPSPLQRIKELASNFSSISGQIEGDFANGLAFLMLATSNGGEKLNDYFLERSDSLWSESSITDLICFFKHAAMIGQIKLAREIMERISLRASREDISREECIQIYFFLGKDKQQIQSLINSDILLATLEKKLTTKILEKSPALSDLMKSFKNLTEVISTEFASELLRKISFLYNSQKK